MFTVTPIGSCRITTPLKMGQARHGLALNLARNYGYCHSPAEAIQQARFLRGEMEIPADIWPLVSRSRSQAELAEQAHEPSDLYFVEIASAKELTVDGVSIQLNYLRSVYPEFFADTTRAARFWELADAGDTAATRAFLSEAWGATDAQRAEAATLARIRRSLVTADSLRRDLRTLAGLLPDLVIVTHVDAVKPDGQTIASRSALIALLREATAALGLPCYDPTELMAEHGQAATLEDDSTSLAHFTPAFGLAMMDDWMRRHIAPRSRAMAATRPAALIAQVEAACADERFAEARERLAGLPDAAALAQEVTARQAAAVATQEAEASDADPADRLRRALHLGDAAGLFALLDRLQGRLDALPCPLLTDLAQACAEAGDLGRAAGLAIAACQMNGQARRPVRLLAELVLAHGLPLSKHVEPALLARVQAQMTEAQIAAALAAPRAPVATLIAAGLPGAGMARIAAIAGLAAAAPALAQWRLLQGKGRIRDADLLALLDRWVAEAATLPDPLHRAGALALLRAADPRHPGTRAALRDARTDLVRRIRAIGKAQDADALQALGSEVQLLPEARPEFDLWTARVLFALGDDRGALAAAETAAEAMPANINIWVLMMRAAARAGDAARAGRAADKVVALSGTETCNLRTEALKLRSDLTVEA